jgi:hypothetical protein
MTMMKDEDIRSLIVARAEYLAEGGVFHREAVIGQIRALVAVLNGGSAPRDTNSWIDILDAAQIPHQSEGHQVGIPEAWLVEHGFVRQISGRFTHPLYSGGW